MFDTLKKNFSQYFIKPEEARFFINPNGVVCLEYRGSVYWKLSARRALPHQHKEQYIFLYNYNDDEIGAVRDISTFPDQSVRILNSLLEKRYFTKEIQQVYSIDDKFSLLIFKVRTDRKQYTDFTVTQPKDSIYRARTGGFLINDADNNLYHIKNTDILAPKDLIRVERYC